MIVSESVKVEGPRLTADVRNMANANGTFSLALTAYGDTLRLFVNEHPDKGRFQVPDVLVPGLEARQQVRLLGGRGRLCAGGQVHFSTAPACKHAAAHRSQLILRHLHRPSLQNWELVKKSYTKARLRLPPAGASPGAEVELRFAPAALEVRSAAAVALCCCPIVCIQWWWCCC